MCLCVLEICPGIASLRSEGSGFREQLEPQPQPQLPTLRVGGGGAPPPRGLTHVLSAERKRFWRILPVQFTGPQVCAATGEGGLSARQDSFPSRKLFESTPSDLSCAPRDPRLREHQETPGLFHIFPLFIFISAEVWEPVNNRQLGWQEITRMSERNVMVLATGLWHNRPVWISCLFIPRL